MPTMTRKTDQDTRKTIVEASMKLFAQRGYHGTSVAQIAEATGLTKGALYWYFKGKEDLFLNVLDCIKKTWQETIMNRVEASDGVIGKLSELFDATSEMVASSTNPYSLHLFLVSAGAQPEMREFEDAIKDAYAGYVKTLADTLRQGQEDGEIRRDVAAESAAVGIIGCLEGIVLQARLYPPATVAAAVAEMKHHFLRSLHTAPKRPSGKAKPAPATADQLDLF
jgi:AcrR family transcriptional regulator